MSYAIIKKLLLHPSQKKKKNFGRELSKSSFLNANNNSIPISLTKHFTSEKRGVTRITFITTLLQLLTELPSVTLLIYATNSGPNLSQNMCTLQTLSHFFSLCNASLSFFLYFIFSLRFRLMIIKYFFFF